MAPVMAQVESTLKIPVVHVNMDAKGSPAYRSYINLFQGSGIPYTVLINASGQKVKDWTGGYTDAGAYIKEVQRNMK